MNNNRMHHPFTQGFCCYQGVEGDGCANFTDAGQDYCNDHLAAFERQARNRQRIANWFRRLLPW